MQTSSFFIISMSFPNTLTIFINTRIRGYPKIKYDPDMSVPDIRANSVYFNPLIKMNQSVVNTIPPGYPATEVVTQFFSKGDFASLINRTIASRSQKIQTLEEATENGTIDNNISIILNTLFKKHNKFYIKGKPYTIYSHEWVNGDWQVDTKSFERNVSQSIYGYGLYGMQKNTLLQNKLASEELNKFKKEHGSALRGFAVSTDMTKFIDDYKSSIGRGVAPVIIEDKKLGKEAAPAPVRSLVKKLLPESILSFDDDANLSSNPVSFNIIYSIDKHYSKDIELNKRVLVPLYQDLIKKGEIYVQAKKRYDLLEPIRLMLQKNL
jgi:hypothetical protein